MDRIKQQFGRVGELITANDTRVTYAKTLTLTWDILRETGILLWLVICLLFVGGDLFWKMSVSLGLKARTWYESTKEAKASEPKSFSEISQSVASTLGSGTATLLHQAKQQLGIDPGTPAPKPASPSTTSQPPAAAAKQASPQITAVETTAASADKSTDS